MNGVTYIPIALSMTERAKLDELRAEIAHINSDMLADPCLDSEHVEALAEILKDYAVKMVQLARSSVHRVEGDWKC